MARDVRRTLAGPALVLLALGCSETAPSNTTSTGGTPAAGAGGSSASAGSSSSVGSAGSSVATAAAGTQSEAEFFAALRAEGVLVRKRYSTRFAGQVTGYAVALPDDLGELPPEARTADLRSSLIIRKDVRHALTTPARVSPPRRRTGAPG